MMTGADIQIENGNWSQIHNAIWQALAKAPLTGEQFRCLMYLLGQTYGYHRKEDRISLGQFAEATGMKRQNVWRALKQLVKSNVVYTKTDGPKRAAVWGFNKYIERWVFDSVITDDDSSEENCNHDRLQSVITDDYSDDTICNHIGLQSVITPHENPKERKKVPAASESSPPPIPELPARPDNFRPFIQAYQNIWGLMPPPFMADEIAEWCERVPLVAWEYALKETMNSGKRQNWKYAKAILNRVEFDGLPSPPGAVQATSVVGFSLEEDLRL